MKFGNSEDGTPKSCGNRISVINTTASAETQNYPIKCGEEGLIGNQVKVSLEGGNRILMIAEISVEGYKRIGK